MSKRLEDMTWDELNTYCCQKIIEGLCGGKGTLSESVYTVQQVIVNWGKATEEGERP